MGEELSIRLWKGTRMVRTICWFLNSMEREAQEIAHNVFVEASGRAPQGRKVFRWEGGLARP